MCNNFFVNLSVDGHLGCFHILATVNHAAVLGVQISVSSEIYLEAELLGRKAVSFLMFGGPSIRSCWARFKCSTRSSRCVQNTMARGLAETRFPATVPLSILTAVRNFRHRNVSAKQRPFSTDQIPLKGLCTLEAKAVRNFYLLC